MNVTLPTIPHILHIHKRLKVIYNYVKEILRHYGDKIRDNM